MKLWLWIKHSYVLPPVNCPTLTVISTVTEINRSNSCTCLAVLKQTAIYRNSYCLWMRIVTGP